MIFKKKIFLLTFTLIVLLQALLFINNKQTTSFKYFKWTFREESIGKLISISFFSGLLISTLLNSSITSVKNTSENIEENKEPLNNDEDLKSNIEMPPQRDIRDAQPTISVNYRVVKNTNENNLKSPKNSSNSTYDQDDWDIDDNDW